jgi:hypothetical protein
MAVLSVASGLLSEGLRPTIFMCPLNWVNFRSLVEGVFGPGLGGYSAKREATCLREGSGSRIVVTDRAGVSFGVSRLAAERFLKWQVS